MINNIINGDCKNELSNIEDNFIDSIITDPPYGIDIMGSDWNRSRIDSLISKSGVIGGQPVGMKFNPSDSIKLQKYLEPIFGEYFRILKPGGFCLVFSQSRSSYRVALALENEGFEIRDQLIWDYGCGQQKAQGIQNFIRKNKNLSNSEKERLTNKLNGKKTPQLAPTFETIWLAQKPKEGNTVDNYVRWKTGLVNFDGKTIKVKFEHSKPSPEERKEAGGHPTQKPVSLMEDLIRVFTKEGDVVLDSFAGSGSTIVACVKLNRSYIGIEKDKSTFNDMTERLNKLT